MRITKRHPTRIEQLAAVRLFAGCTREELAQIDRLGTQIDVEAGRVIQREGGNADAFFVIVDGEATTSQSAGLVGRLRRGGFFCGRGLLDGGPDTATVTAATRMRVLVFGRREFASLIAGTPPVARAIMRTLASEARALNATLARLQSAPIRQPRHPVPTLQRA